MGSGFWTWANEHWFLAFLLLSGMVSGIWRTICIGMRGWPPPVVKACDCKKRAAG